MCSTRLEPQVPPNLAAQAPLPSRETAPQINLDDLEMEVRYDLHKLGADLGESVEIATSSGELVVNAASLSQDMKQQLATLLAQKPGVRLEFQEPGTRRPSGRPTTLTPLPQIAAPQDDERLRNFFGGAQEEENYARLVLQTSTNVLAHLYALDDLAVRWSPEQGAHLSPEAKAQLATMVRDHARDVQAGVSDLRTRIDFLLKGLGSPEIAQIPAAGSATWQDASASALDAARLTDRILRSLLTTSDAPMPLDEALPKLEQSAQELDQAARELLASGG